MCSRVQCPTCHKPTWAGCGRHIEQALAGVPHDQRCSCREAAQKAPTAQQSQVPSPVMSPFSLLTGRK
ncbi:MAG: hypothetical protein U0228_01875 [Myxococcaceae bacterium]